MILPKPSRLARLVAVAAIATSIAACVPATGALGTPATQPPTGLPSIEAPSDDATPEPSSSSPAAPASASPAASTGPTGTSASPSPPAASPSPSTGSADTTIVRAYFFLGSFTGNAGLAPVLREIPQTQAVATAAMRALLAGPNATELGASPAMYTDVPAGTRLLGLSIKGGVATVDLSAEFGSGGDRAAILGRLAQVVYTLTQFSTVDAVSFELDGQPAPGFGGTGIVLDHPVGRDDYTDQLPAIFMDRPAWGAALTHPGRVSGVANVFEATFQVRLTDARGAVLVDRQVMASCGTGCWGTFKADLTYTVAKGQYGTLRVYDRSAKDGSPEDITEYPVWLTPAP